MPGSVVGRPTTIAAGFILVSAGFILTTGCSGGSAIVTPTTTTTSSAIALGGRHRLPPSNGAALAGVIRPLITGFNDEIQRVWLDTTEQANGQVILSIYLKPIDVRSPSAYAEAIAPIAKALIPVLFERYPGVTAIDECQEEQFPPAGIAEPPPVTRVFILRPDANRIDWSKFDLAAARQRSRGTSATVQLSVTKAVADSAPYRSAAPS